MIDPDSRDVQAFRRTADGQWMLHDMNDADVLSLSCIDAEVSMAEVFDGVEAAA